MDNTRIEIINYIQVALDDYKRLVSHYNSIVNDKTAVYDFDGKIHRNMQIDKFKRKLKLMKHDIKDLHRALSEFDLNNR